MTSRYRACSCLALVVAFLVTALPIHAQGLEQTSGPPGAGLFGVIEHEGGLLASGLGSGAFARASETWTAQPLDLRLGSLFRVGETLFAHNSSDLYRSTDGVAWTPAWDSSTSSVSVASVAGDSLLIIANDSLYISGDGLAWRSLIRGRVVVDEEGDPTEDTILLIMAAARTPDGALWIGAFGGSQSGIFRSFDGETWQFVSPGPFVIPRLLYVSAAGALYTVISGEVFRYEADSEAWASLAAEFGAFSTQGFVESGQTLFVYGHAVAEAALFRHDGAAWEAVSLPVSSYSAIAPSDEGVFVLGEDRLFHGPGDGTWMALDDGLIASSAQLYTLGETVVASTRRGWVRSADAGATWEPVGFPDIGAVYDFDGVIFGTGADDVYRSTDGGETWETVNAGINPGVFHRRNLRTMAAHDGKYYSGLYSSRAIVHQGGEVVGGVYRSTDGGSSWALFGSGFPINDNGARAGVYQLAATDGHLVAATQEGLVRVAHGEHAWESLPSPASAFGVLSLRTLGDRLFLATYNQVFVSTDDGLTWTELAEGLPDGGFALTLSVAEETVFALLRPLPDPVAGLYRLDGDEWVDTGVAVPDWVQFYSTAVAGGHLFVGTSNHGVWRVPVGEITVASEPGGVAASAPELAPAFPNPTRDRATLRLTLPEAADVRVEVFDVQGRRVAVIHDGRMEAGAGHVLELDADGLAAGVYLVRAHSGGVLLDRRVTVVR